MMDEDRGSSLKSLEMGVGPGLEMVGQNAWVGRNMDLP